MAKIGVLGAGTWGMALSRMLSNSGHDITVWSALENEVTQYAATRRHPNLPGMVIPDQISFTGDISQAASGTSCSLLCPPFLSGARRALQLPG